MSDSQTNSKITAKLNRVQGQVNAIGRMIDNQRDCMEVVTQIAAARSALAGIARDLLSDEAMVCVKSPEKQKEFDKLLKTLFNVS